jgi:hypothetical protein
MSRSSAPSVTRADRASLIALVLVVLALVVLWISFRGLVFLTLPLALGAFALGAWGAIAATRRRHHLAAIFALVLGLVLLLLALAALVADLNVSDGFDVYQRTR